MRERPTLESSILTALRVVGALFLAIVTGDLLLRVVRRRTRDHQPEPAMPAATQAFNDTGSTGDRTPLAQGLDDTRAGRDVLGKGLPVVETEERLAREEAPVEEEIHLPDPSIWPAVFAAGLTLVGFGAVTHAVFALVGAALAAYALAKWIGDLRHE